MGAILLMSFLTIPYLGSLLLICGIGCAKGYTRYWLFLIANVLSLLRTGFMAYILLLPSGENDEDAAPSGENDDVPILGPAALVEFGFACYFIYFSYRGISGEPEKPKVSDL